MEQGLKERLVGAAVLVAIAVWLIPWVLDGPEAPVETSRGSLELPAAEEPMPMRTQTLRLGEPAEESSAAAPSGATPPRDDGQAATPPAEPAGAADATPVVAAAGTESRSAPAAVPPPAADPPAATARQPAATAATPPPKPAPAAAATGDWIVQLGSFSEEANARRLAQRSSTFGYKADVSSYRSGSRTLYRVRVGPAKSRAEAEATASALKAHGLNDARVVAAR
jgi:DedD protein